MILVLKIYLCDTKKKIQNSNSVISLPNSYVAHIIIYIYHILCIANKMYVNLFMLGTTKNKLICPCLCTGDQEFIHIHCLEIMTNVRRPVPYSQSYRCLNCEIPFPLELKYKSLIEVSEGIDNRKVFVEDKIKVRKKKNFSILK